jgi:putative Ca2+/H+ antiporter (TMEM165/GDT1 family)
VVGLVVEFALVFAVIGGTELIDRTNFALIGLASKQPPLATWAGAASAFALTSALAVLVGAALLAALHGQIAYLRLGGGAVLLGYAGYLAIVPEADRRPPSGRSGFATAFLWVGLLELGDTTMILIIVFVSAMPSAPIVFVAAALALALVAASAALIGSRLGARVEPRVLDRLVTVILAVVGAVTILYALEPAWFPALTA